MEKIGTHIKEVYQILFEHYGPQGWWPIQRRAGSEGFDEDGYHPGIELRIDQEDAFEIAVGAVLTQNTSWKNVRMSLSKLHEYIDAHALTWSPSDLLSLPRHSLAELIRSSGYYNQKAKKLHFLADFLRKCEKEPQRNALLSIWGIGPETADSILLYVYRQPYFVVDAYSRRIFGRTTSAADFSKGTYDTVQKIFHQAISPDPTIYAEYHALLVQHAKVHCRARKPLCTGCPLSKICNFIEK